MVGTEGEATVIDFRSRLKSTELAEKFATMVEKGQQTALEALRNLSEKQAEEVAQGLNMTGEQLARSGILTQMRELAASLSIEQRGPTLHGNVRIPTDQALGTLLALSVYGVQKYVLRAKQSEANLVLWRIGKGMLQYHREHHRLPPSAAQLPADLPPGHRYQTSSEDWQKPGWAELGVSIDSPQYYAYEVVVAPNGRSFRAYARGDLDGDGISSELSLGGTIEKHNGEDILVLEPEVTENK